MNATDDTGETVEAAERRRLRARLRAEADAHRPDRARMLARVTREAEEPRARRGLARLAHVRPRFARFARLTHVRPPRAGARAWPRVAGAVGAVLLVLGLGGTTAWWAQQGEDGTGGATAGPPPTVRTPSATGAPTGGPDAERADGPLRSDGSLDPGSNAYWSQTEVSLRTSERLSTLTVELRIATKGKTLSSTGSWRTLPASGFDTFVAYAGGALVYRWTLKEGQTVPPGTHVFAGQYDHPGGERRGALDTYTAEGTAGGRELRVSGTVG
ncbi:hypothetical protein [Streptomyces armeniacus]|uniref:hypothetical protein n=1 Tax=Streptomyces armeniacus TaxID=83291 RepID=UPI001FE47925|nr:hypothetical protein [Streptomyces armeniacus]